MYLAPYPGPAYGAVRLVELGMVSPELPAGLARFGSIFPCTLPVLSAGGFPLSLEKLQHARPK